MATRTYRVEKLKPKRKILPCQDHGCDINTNKRYRSPAGTVYVACCFDHAEKACFLDRRKMLALVAA